MGFRIVHVINGECEIFLHKINESVKIRVSESSSDDSASEPTTFEFEGNIPALRDLFSSLNTVMSHIENLNGEMN